MSRKTGNKWKTECCGRCGDPHSGYSGKLDSHGIEYVVCGSTHKRMDVGPETSPEPIKALLDKHFYSTEWIREDIIKSMGVPKDILCGT